MKRRASEAAPCSINPATGAKLATYPFHTDARIEEILGSAAAAARSWGRLAPAERAQLLRAAAAQLRRDRALLASGIALEMGKPIREAEAEIDASAWHCELIAEHGPEWLADEPAPLSAAHSYLAFRPLGTLLAILSWNFPVWHIFRCAAGALMAGNTVLLKHAPNVLGCAEAVAALMSRAGIPPGVFEHLNIPVARIGAVIADPRVAAVTLTGSPTAGAAVAAQAGAACKKCILELHGPDAFIALDDADLTSVVPAAVRARFSNCGQACVAARRFIVLESVAEEFATRLAAAAADLRMGDPLSCDTQLGPLARKDLRTLLDTQVTESLAQGARLLTGGRLPSRDGFYYEPTVLTDVNVTMPVAEQETFGPVAAILRAKSLAHAIEMANQSRCGLGAIVWTADVARAQALARELDVGTVFINGIGGATLSGYGRQPDAARLRELLNAQAVLIESAAS